MVKILVTIDVESVKNVRDGKVYHLYYREDIERPCKKIIQIANKYQAKITFMVPVNEIIVRNKELSDLMKLMIANKHDIQTHIHCPTPLLDEKTLVNLLESEVEMVEEIVGVRPIGIRAGGYNVGSGSKWINAVLKAGLKIDCSVWPGASTLKSKKIKDKAVKNEERRWGKGALYFDFRGAPMFGPYRVRDDNIARIGKSKLIEIPITVSKYEELNPWKYRFDPKNQNYVRLKRTVMKYYNKELIEMIWHSTRVTFKGIDLSWLYFRRFEAILKFLSKINAEFVTISDVWELIKTGELTVVSGE